MPTETAAGVIRHLPLFRNAPPGALESLLGAVHATQYRRGDAVLARGQPIRGLLAVGYGMVKLVLRGPGGPEKALRLVGPGETFGEAALFLERPVPVDAVAVVDTLVATVPAAPLLALVDSSPAFARTMLASMSQRMQALVGDFEAATLHGAAGRVAAYLESLAPPGGEPALVRLPGTKTLLASRLGMTKETLSRVLRELGSAEVIRVGKREIVLLDRARLARVQ